MIIKVGSPGYLPTKWRNLIQRSHVESFDFYLDNAVGDHWWFADIQENEIAGVAGARREPNNSLFLGPCVVFDLFRGRGIQRDFIKYRERFGKRNDFAHAITYTHYQNYASANNFVKMGYSLSVPWDSSCDNTGIFLYWRKKL